MFTLVGDAASRGELNDSVLQSHELIEYLRQRVHSTVYPRDIWRSRAIRASRHRPKTLGYPYRAVTEV